MTGIQYYFAVFTWPFTCLGLTRSTLPFSNFNPGKNQDSMTGKNQDSMTLICLLYRIVNFHGQIFLFYILSYKFLVMLEESQKKKSCLLCTMFFYFYFLFIYECYVPWYWSMKDLGQEDYAFKCDMINFVFMFHANFKTELWPVQPS